MDYKPGSYSIILPNPRDPNGSWEGVGSFDFEVEAIEFLVEKFGADEEGRISLLSHIPGEGWLLDLPDPAHPTDAWIFVESFDRKRDAVRFVKKHYDGDSEGRIRPIDIMWVEGGPKDWSPTGEIKE